MELLVIIALLPLALAVAATVNVVRGGAPLRTVDVAWLLLIWLVPVVGPLLWFVAGRRTPMSAPR
ncbi:PLDc N-terminal domain-containing protein [Georgenia faecalis]|uniref:PLDc N-terminal domain-containing protein n=1 Tax=Georgenia faecalis TaxID=2483799 RepID=A0ABV9D6Z0_9MICO|nr:PLDc N-terminal domain-containing protein [Georgenia faecalis]